jgi:hypothetical protein
MKTSIQFSFIAAAVFFSLDGIHAQLSNDKAIKPGVLWMDADGKRINAHGGCVIFYEGIYYWYGEEKFRACRKRNMLTEAFIATRLKTCLTGMIRTWFCIYQERIH